MSNPEVLARLLKQLRNQAISAKKHLDLYSGAAIPAPLSSSKERRVFQRFEEESRGNFLAPAADAFADRLRITSIRNDDTGRHDKETWRVFRDAHTRRDVRQAILDAIVTGHGYLLVLPHRRVDGRAVTRAFTPLAAVTEDWDDDAGETRYGLTVTTGTDGVYTVRVYDDTHVWTWTAKEFDALWDDSGALTAVGESTHNLGVCPLVRIGEGRSLIDRGFLHQRRANQSALHLAAVEKAQSFFKTYVLGMELERDDDGELIPPALPSSPAKVGVLPPGPETGLVPTVHESKTTSGSGLIENQAFALQQLAGAVGVPVHYLLPSAAASVSPEVLRTSEQVFRTKLLALADVFGEGLQPALAALRAAAGLPPKDTSVVFDMRLPQEWSLAADGVVKAVQAGVPLNIALVRSGVAEPEEADVISDATEGQQIYRALDAAVAKATAVDASLGGDSGADHT